MYPTGPSTELTRQRLTDLRQGLLRLHKNLLESERVAYERVVGRIDSRGELFQLVVSDPWFAWLAGWTTPQDWPVEDVTFRVPLEILRNDNTICRQDF